MEKRDPLFYEEEWYTNPLFSGLRSHYQMWREQAEQVIKLWPQGDANSPSRQTTQFYLDAMAPSHIPFLHPKVIQATLEEGGANLQRGAQHLMEHANHSVAEQQPFFLPPLVDTKPFEMGYNVVATPGHVIWQEPLFQLIRYTPKQKKTRSTPLLVIPPWINKYYILDLSEHNSFVGWAVEQGVDVYIVSWVNPSETQADQGLVDYVQAITAAIAKVTTLTNTPPHVTGYCVGGVGLLLALACQPKSASGVTLLTTPIDFQHMQPFSNWMDHHFISSMEQSIKQGDGIIHGQWFSLLFSLMRSHEMIWKNGIDQYFLGKDAPALDFLFWNNDPINVVGKLHTEYLEAFFEKNMFMNPPFDYMGKKRSLRSIQCPIFLLNTRKDHIVPYQASTLAAQQFWPQSVRVLADSGHVAGVINPPGKTKYGFTVNDENHAGSWWQYWMDWLQPQLGEWQDAPQTPKANMLETAPGSYVRAPSAPSRPLWSNMAPPSFPTTFSAPFKASVST